MRVAHITDLHVERVPSLGQLFNKRAFGAVNLYALGRAHHFSAVAQSALIPAVLAQNPDAVICTGDLTATATPEEFDAAGALLAPLRALPFHCIPGNHDVYTTESLGRYAERFDPLFAPVRTVPLGLLNLVLVDVCFDDTLSRGQASEQTLVDLDAALAKGPAIVALHYPLRNRRGAPYGPATRALANADAVEAVLLRHPVRAVLHGHEHHGFHTQLGGIPIYNPGASGYAYLPAKRRTAHFNVYTLDATGIRDVERYAFDGTHFGPEAGGAYATGG